jgi:hypothetical protein
MQFGLVKPHHLPKFCQKKALVWLYIGWDFKKNLPKNTLTFNGGERGGETQKTITFGGKLNSFYHFFFLSAFTIVTYIFIGLTCTSVIIILNPCALNVDEIY